MVCILWYVLPPWSSSGRTDARERRFELDLTQKELAEQAETSHSYISKLERGDHMPTIPVLTGILDEELLIGIERREADEEPERDVAPVPEAALA